MTIQTNFGSGTPTKPPHLVLLTAKEAARFLKVSLSWLAKARMRGDGPAYIKVGRSIRYTELALGPGPIKDSHFCKYVIHGLRQEAFDESRLFLADGRPVFSACPTSADRYAGQTSGR
jgi:hypothetical protein